MVLRSMIAVAILLIPPWVVSVVADPLAPWYILSVSTGWFGGDARFDPEAVVPSLVSLLVWVSWLRIAVSFSRDCLRILVRRPLGTRSRWSMRLALWVLVSAPAVAVSSAPARAAVVSLETTERDLGERSVPSMPVLVSSLVVAGLLIRVRARRRSAQRQGETAGACEVLVGESGFEHDELALVRLDMAVRSLASLGASSFRLVLVRSDGSLLAELPHERTARLPWVHHAPRIWRLDDSVHLSDLVSAEGDGSAGTPVVVPVGRTSGGDVWVNLQSVGVFGVHGPGSEAEQVWQGLCQGLALSPLAESVSIISVDGIDLRGRRDIVIGDPARACLVAERLQTGETPSILLARERVRCPTAVAMIHRELPAEGEFGLTWSDGQWYLLPMKSSIEPWRCSLRDLDVIDDIVPSVPYETETIEQCSAWIPDCLPPHRFVASVLGVPHVRHTNGRRVVFERNRSEELVIWLSLHDDRQRRSIARHEIWSIAIKDATFSNVVSDARRSLTIVEDPPDEDDWIGVTLTDELPLHPLVVSDADLLARCYEHARMHPELDGRRVLEYGLSLVTGVPFSGSLYMWRDTTGLGSQYAMLVVRAASLLADMISLSADILSGGRGETGEVDDWIDGVYRATAKGLLAVPGHEDLVLRRMELHARLLDQAALLAEWQSYCRALAADDWGDVESSSKMVEAWRRLTRSVGMVDSVVEESVR